VSQQGMRGRKIEEEGRVTSSKKDIIHKQGGKGMEEGKERKGCDYTYYDTVDVGSDRTGREHRNGKVKGEGTRKGY